MSEIGALTYPTNNRRRDKKLEKIKYRNDIDGLRGICVLAVVVYHVFPKMAPGGFLGVDIFFGISGFLICQLILNQIQAHNFSLFGFFASRIRRIFPALILVFLFSVSAGSYLLPFDEFRQLNLHIATGSVFSSNFLLANELGYFDTASARKPLLHLWSLAVEEQFYVIFPFVILLLYRSRLRIGLAILTFAISSYAAGVYTAQGDADGAYFYSWCRFYEILAGAALAVGASSNATSIRSQIFLFFATTMSALMTYMSQTIFLKVCSILMLLLLPGENRAKKSIGLGRPC